MRGLFGYFQYPPFCANEDSTAKQADPYDRWYEFQIDYFDYTLFGGMKLPCITLEGQQVFHIEYKACEVDKHFEVHYIIHKSNAGEYHRLTSLIFFAKAYSIVWIPCGKVWERIYSICNIVKTINTNIGNQRPK